MIDSLRPSFVIAALIVQTMQVASCAHRSEMRRIEAERTDCIRRISVASPDEVDRIADECEATIRGSHE